MRRLEQRAFAAEREAREVAAEIRAAAAVGKRERERECKRAGVEGSSLYMPFIYLRYSSLRMCTQSLGLDADRLRSDLDRASRAAEASEAARVKAAQETANQLAELQKKADEKLAFVVAAAEQAKKEASNRQAALEQVKDLRVKALKTKKYDR